MSEPVVSKPVAAPRKYDLYSQATKNDPHSVFAAMRRDDPVFCQAGLDGETMIWFLTRFEDVQAMLQNAATFVRDPRNAHPEGAIPTMSGLEALLGNHMLNKDGSEHQRLRNLIGQAFTPARVKNLRPRVQQIADELIARVQADGQMDFVADYAYQLPTIVIAELLGIPSEDREHFKAWSSAVISPAFTDEQQAKAGQLLTEFVDYLRELFVKRRATPRDDLVTALLQAEESGERLSEEELFSTMVLLIVAGHETTVNLIGNALLSLLHQPETLQTLKDHPGQMGAALEEFLRSFDVSSTNVSSYTQIVYGVLVILLLRFGTEGVVPLWNAGLRRVFGLLGRDRSGPSVRRPPPDSRTEDAGLLSSQSGVV